MLTAWCFKLNLFMAASAAFFCMRKIAGVGGDVKAESAGDGDFAVFPVGNKSGSFLRREMGRKQGG